MQHLGTSRQLAVSDVLSSEGDESNEAFVIVSGGVAATVEGHEWGRRDRHARTNSASRSNVAESGDLLRRVNPTNLRIAQLRTLRR